MDCQSCGTQLGPEDLNCPSCGVAVGAFEKTVMRSAQSLQPLPPAESNLLDGKWAVGAELGHGGMGTVYAATDVELDRRVAIKMLSPSLVKEPEVVTRFEREAKMLARLEHPNLVPIYSVGRKDGLPFIVMKYLEGNTLAGHLRERVRLSSTELLSITRQLCAGIAFIHSKGIIHRDIKPGNVFISPEGHVTILDLGVAHDSKNQLTKTGLLIGTPRYMSPEQILYGSGRIDHRSDLYALATVIFEMLTGAPVFDAETDFSVMRAHTDQAPPDASTVAPDIPRAVGVVLNRALAKDPKDRYASATELYEALEAAYALGTSTPAPSAAMAPGPADSTRAERRPATGRPPTSASAVAAGRPRTPVVTSNSAIAAGRPRTPAVTSATAMARPQTNAGLTTPMKAQRRPGGTPAPSDAMRANTPIDTPAADELNVATDPQSRVVGRAQLDAEDAAVVKSGPPKALLFGVGGVVVVGAIVGAVLAFGGKSDVPTPSPVPIATNDDGRGTSGTKAIDGAGARGSTGAASGGTGTGAITENGHDGTAGTTGAEGASGATGASGSAAGAGSAATAQANGTQVAANDVRGNDAEDRGGTATGSSATGSGTGSGSSKTGKSRTNKSGKHEGGSVASSSDASPTSARASGPSEVRVVTTFNGNASWAWLDVDGVRKGTTPSILKLEPGTYDLRLSRPGYKTFEKKITVTAGQPLRVPVELKQ